MRTTQDRIWFKKSRHSIEGRIEFANEIKCLNSGALDFGQELQIREQIKDEIFRNMFGQMPRTCQTIIKHLHKVEKELREENKTLLANRIASSIALVASLQDQMTVQRPVEVETDD